MKFRFGFLFLAAILLAGCASIDEGQEDLQIMDDSYWNETYSKETLHYADTEALSGKRVLAYIRGTWEFPNGQLWEAQNVRGDLLTDLNISFARINKEGQVYLSCKEHNKKEIKELQEKYPDLRVNISIGGWEAEGFSMAAANPVRRERFVQSVIDLVRELNFAGVDIDWEYPVGPDWGQSIKSDKHDRVGYILLLSDLRGALNALGEETGFYYTLSTAVPSGLWFPQKNDIRTASLICDYVNLMSYDYYGGWSGTTGHNASLYLNPDDPNKWSSDLCVKKFISSGVAPEKLVMGIPFYSFVWRGVPDGGTHGLFQKPEKFSGEITNGQLEKNYSESYEDFWDDNAKYSYRYNAETKVFVDYISPRMLKEIASYAQKMNLGGLMYWEYAHDADAYLLSELVSSY